MTKADEYRRALANLEEWEPFLLERSGLPGPRGNIELAQVVADLGTRGQFERFLTWTPDRAPVGSREEFLAFCGTLGLGRLAADGDMTVLLKLRKSASDPRWRAREGVAMALQRLGAADMRALLGHMRSWAKGNDFERRAAAAALCEPALLKREQDARSVLVIFDAITAGLSRSTDRLCKTAYTEMGHRAATPGRSKDFQVRRVSRGKRGSRRTVLDEPPHTRPPGGRLPRPTGRGRTTR
jgi:hypothetical protein